MTFRINVSGMENPPLRTPRLSKQNPACLKVFIGYMFLAGRLGESLYAVLTVAIITQEGDYLRLYSQSLEEPLRTSSSGTVPLSSLIKKRASSSVSWYVFR
jgi:hypothetical protein